MVKTTSVQYHSARMILFRRSRADDEIYKANFESANFPQSQPDSAIPPRPCARLATGPVHAQQPKLEPCCGVLWFCDVICGRRLRRRSVEFLQEIGFPLENRLIVCLETEFSIFAFRNLGTPGVTLVLTHAGNAHAHREKSNTAGVPSSV